MHKITVTHQVLNGLRTVANGNACGGEDHTACPDQRAAPRRQTGVLQPLRKVPRWPKGSGMVDPDADAGRPAAPVPRRAADLSAQRRDGPHVAVHQERWTRRVRTAKAQAQPRAGALEADLGDLCPGEIDPVQLFEGIRRPRSAQDPTSRKPRRPSSDRSPPAGRT